MKRLLLRNLPPFYVLSQLFVTSLGIPLPCPDTIHPR